MSAHSRIKLGHIQVGDIITAVSPSSLYANVKVTQVDEDGSIYGESYGFDPVWDWRYFLIERPKTLPTKLGSVVKASGVEWVLCDPDNPEPWFSPKEQNWLATEDFAGIDWEEVV